MKTFSEVIQKQRNSKELTVKALAQKAGVPEGTVHRYCIGRSEPTAGNLLKICKALEVDPKIFMVCIA